MFVYGKLVRFAEMSIDDHVVIGRIIAPRGIRGELKVSIESEEPERFLDLRSVLIGDRFVPYAVLRARLFKGNALLQLEGIDDPDAAESLRGQLVLVPIEDAIPLAEDEYYAFELVGLTVLEEDGTPLGTLDSIMATGANDVYVVKGPRGEIMLPAIQEVVLGIDIDRGLITVRLMDGLV